MEDGASGIRLVDEAKSNKFGTGRGTVVGFEVDPGGILIEQGIKPKDTSASGTVDLYQ